MKSPGAVVKWKALSYLDHEPPLHRPNDLFLAGPKVGLYKQFSLPLADCYIPYTLSPTVTYHQVMTNHLHKNGISVDASRFPYQLCLAPGRTANLSLTIHLYQPNIAVLTLTLSRIQPGIAAVDIRDAIQLQQLASQPPIDDLIKRTISLVESLDQKHPGETDNYSYKPAFQLNEVASPDEFPRFIADNERAVVGTLIRNFAYETMKKSVVDDVLAKNVRHNAKSSTELMLLDKQGILSLESGAEAGGIRAKKRFSRATDLMEIAMVTSTFLQRFWQIRARHENFAEFILSKLRLWIEKPGIIFSESVTNRLMWELLADELRLSDRLSVVTNYPTLEQSIRSKVSFFSQFDRWWDDRDFVYSVEEKSFEEAGLDLSFLGDPGLRRVIVEDFLEAERCLHGRNFKAAVLLCGSVAEALLTDALIRNNPGHKPNRYYQLDLGKVSDLTENQSLLHDPNLFKMLEPLRHYRNLVHPGVQVRKQLAPDEHKARIGVEVVKLLVQDLARTRTP